MADDVPPERRVRWVRSAKAQAIPFMLWTTAIGFAKRSSHPARSHRTAREVGKVPGSGH
jgi:hypothetical protein